jgi:antitoxin VapB
MGILETKTFKSGNSIAIRLPREVAFAEGTAVTIEKRGDALVIRPAKDPVEEKRKVLEFVEALKALPRVGEIEQRDTDLPERPGLI